MLLHMILWGPTLLRADKENGYFMTDSSTGMQRKIKLKILRYSLAETLFS